MRLIIFAPTPRGGHPEHVRDVASALLRLNGDISITWPVRLDHREDCLVSTMDQPRVIVGMPERPAKRGAKDVLKRLVPSRRHDASFLRYLIFRRRDFDWLLVEEMQRYTLAVMVIVARLMGIKVAVHVHNVRRHEWTGSVADRLDEALMRRSLHLAQAVSVYGKENALALTKRFGVTPVVIDHGVRPKRLVAKEPPAEPSFLFFGVNRPGKGLDVLVEALALLPFTCQLVVAGTTSEPDAKATAELLAGLNCRWLNSFISAAEVLALSEKCTAMVLPYTKFEAQSGVLHLAIELALPVVATEVGAIGRVVEEHGIGLVCAPGDPRALATALQEINAYAVNVSARKRVIDSQAELAWERTLVPLVTAMSMAS